MEISSSVAADASALQCAYALGSFYNCRQDETRREATREMNSAPGGTASNGIERCRTPLRSDGQ